MDEKKNDVISSPDHYKLTGLDVEVKDVIKSVLGTVGFLGFYKGNIIKYILRANKKNGLEDLKKARQYLDWLIEELDEDRNLDGQLSYLDVETTKNIPQAFAIDADKILVEDSEMNKDITLDEFNRELTPEESRELNDLSRKMLHKASSMTKEEMERHRELFTKKLGNRKEIKEEQREICEKIYKLQEKLSKKVTK